MGISTIQVPWQNIDAIQQHPKRMEWDEDSVVTDINPDALKEIAKLFAKCGEGDSVYFNLKRWEENKAAIKANFEVLRDSVTPTIEKVPSLCSLLDVKPSQFTPPHSPKRESLPGPAPVAPFNLEGENQNLGLSDENKNLKLKDLEAIEPIRISPPPSPKGPAPSFSNAIIPPAIIEHADLANLLGYYKALELQIAELEAVTEKKIDKTDLAGELARILRIDDILLQRDALLQFFQILFETIDVKGDGNCLPRSIVCALHAANDPVYGQWKDGMELEESVDWELEMAKKLRNDVIEFMRNDESFIDFVSNLPRKDVNYSLEDFAREFVREEQESEEEYRRRYDRHRYRLCLDELEKDGCYFSSEFIAPLAKMLGNYKIHVYAPPLVFVKDNQIVLNENSIFGSGERPLHILNLGEHFLGLKPR